MKSNYISILIALLIPITQSQARIGETEKQIEARYGPPVKNDKGDSSETYYKLNKVLIGVNFKAGKSFFEVYRMEDGTALSSSVVEALLRANSLGSTWRELDSNDAKRRFILNSEEAWAALDGDSSKLMIGQNSAVSGF